MQTHAAMQRSQRPASLRRGARAALVSGAPGARVAPARRAAPRPLSPSAAAAAATATVAPAAAAPADTARPEGAEAPAPAAPAPFVWTKAWYPAAAEEHLDPSKPNKVTLFGQDFVLWRDASGAWHAQRDLCPHRLAALSDGFVDAQGGQIVCSYHGWRFDAKGRCVDIPQLKGDAMAHATACGSARTCVKTFPIKAKGGLLWLWPDASPTAAAESEAASIPLPPELEDEEVSPLEGRWFVREQPYSFDLFLENVLDPAHVDFAHDGVAGFSATSHKSLGLQLVEDNGPQGFVYKIIPSKPNVKPSLLTFAAPSHVSIIETSEPPPVTDAAAGKDTSVRPGSGNTSIRSALVFYVYPTRPGWSRFHGTSYVVGPDNKPVKSFSIFSRAMPAWLQHTLGHTFLAGDDLHLYNGSKNLARAGFDHTQAYYPVTQDGAVLHMRRWLDTHAGGSPPWPAHMAGAGPLLANLDLERPQVLDRYNQHVRHCAHCSAALDGARRAAANATIVAVAAAAAALLAASLKLAAAALAPSAAASVAASAPGWAAATVAAAGGAAPLVAIAIAAAALLVRAGAWALEGQLVGFHDYHRKPFPASGAGAAGAAAAQASVGASA